MNTNEMAGVLATLVTFTQVVEGGSFSAAGRAMDLSPSAVARQMDRLERALDLILFQRTTRSLCVTEAGREIYELTRTALAGVDALLARARALGEVPQGLLRVTAPVAFGKRVLAPLMPRFLERYPKVQVELDFSDGLADLLRDGFDLAVRITERPPEDRVARVLTPIRYVLVCDRAYPEPLPETPAALAAYPVFMPRDGGFDQACCFVREGQEYRISIQPRLLSNNSDAMLEALSEGRGMGILPSFVAARGLDAGNLQVVLPDYELVASRRAVAYVIYPPRHLIAPKAQVFIDFLMENIQQRLD